MHRTSHDVSLYRSKEFAKGLTANYVHELVSKYCAATQYLIVAGGRDLNDWEAFYSGFNAWFDAHDPDYQITLILSGMANGADSMGYLTAEDRGIPYEEYPANWDLYGDDAGKVRNTEMSCRATHLLAFWDRKSPGTRDMIIKARKRGLHVTVVYYNTVEPKKVNTLW